ncbi:HhH-GPD superfamily base excision DNA repair protein [Ceratobasidium sp. AG-Ba]|nr:HhH-GPD superfamily base excision DNA repair protein [Ceratobasidium sp. AG-Ba]
MPPKRLTSAYTPTRVKLEDVDSLPAPKSGPRKRGAPVKLGSDDDTPRRSPRKRQRVNLTDPSDSKDEPHPKSESESSLTSLDDSEYDEAPGPSAGMNISKFAYSASRPRRPASVKTPLKKLKIEDEAETEEVKPKTKTQKTSPTKKLNASPRKKKGIVMELDKPHPAPPNWEKQYKLIEEMRENIQAPVDTMGCCKSMSGIGELKDQRFGTLVSLMLSSQTKDEVTWAAVENLRQVLPGGLTVDSVLAADPSVISGAINKVGFWKRKTEYLKSAAATLRDNFNGDVPKTIDELCSLQGVGPKMSFLVLQTYSPRNAGIGVDVHVQRITNRLGWHDPPTTTPEQTRTGHLSIQKVKPAIMAATRTSQTNQPPLGRLWSSKSFDPSFFSMMAKSHPQVICLPVGPRCDACALASEGLCPSASSKASAKGRKPIVYKKEKPEAPGAPDLDVVGLIRVDDGVKQEEEDVKVECDIGEPRVQIKFED